MVPSTSSPTDASTPTYGKLLIGTTSASSAASVRYLETLPVILGRSPDSPGHIQVGTSSDISRNHVEISYDTSLNSYQIKCLSKNGCHINGIYIPVTSSSVHDLATKALVQLGSHLLYFIAPGASGETPKTPPVAQILTSVLRKAHDQPLKRKSSKRKGPVSGASPRLKKSKSAPAVTGPPAAGGDITTEGQESMDETSAGPPITTWSRTARERFRRAFLMWGFNLAPVLEAVNERNDTGLPEAAEPIGVPLSSIDLYAIQFTARVRYIASKSGEVEQDYLRTLDEILERARTERALYCDREHPADGSLIGWSLLTKNATKWMVRIALLYTLGKSVKALRTAHPDDFTTQDEHLPVDPHEIPSQSELGSVDHKTVDTSSIAGASLPHMLDKCGAIKGRPLHPAWTRAHDIDLAYGTLRHGFGQFELIRTDPRLCFRAQNWLPDPHATGGSNGILAPELVRQCQSAIEQAERDNIPKENRLLWPRHLALIGRLKRIAQALRVQEVDVASKQEKKIVKPERKEEENVSPSKCAWTQRERTTFQKVALSLGCLRPWSYLRNCAPNLAHKSDAQLEDYAQAFERGLRKALGRSMSENTEQAEKKGGRKVVVTKATAQKVEEKRTLVRTLRSLLEKYTMEEVGEKLEHDQFDKVSTKWTYANDYELIELIARFGTGPYDDMPNAKPLVEKISAAYESKTPMGTAAIMRRLERLLAILEPNSVTETPNRTYSYSKKLAKENKTYEIPSLPFNATSRLEVLEWGQIDPKYQSKYALYPIGYKTKRVYQSFARANEKCDYFLEIATDEKDELVFKIAASDTEQVIQAKTTALVWKQVEKRIAIVNGQIDAKSSQTSPIPPKMNGLRAYGLTIKQITPHLEFLPNALLCDQYEFREVDPDYLTQYWHTNQPNESSKE